MTVIPPDPLMRDVRLTNFSCHMVLGRPVNFATNCRKIHARIRETFSDDGASIGFAGVSDFPKIQLIRHEVSESGDDHGLAFRMPHSDRLLISTMGSFGVVERDRSRAYAYVSESVIEDIPFFRRAFIEAMTLFLVSDDQRFPIHAASVGRDDCVVLLAGKSGCGKSTLAFTAARSGLVAFGEDVVYVQTSPDLRAWTLAGDITLLPEVASRYNDVKDISPTRLATGKEKVIAANRTSNRLDRATRLGVCVLSPGHETASINAISSDEVTRELLSHVETGFDTYSAEARENTVRALARNGGWRLNLSPNPEDSIPLIRRMLSEIVQSD